MSHTDKKPFSLSARFASFRHAFRGVALVFRYCHNMWIELFFAGFAALLGYVLCISRFEWLALILALGVLIMAEVFNTAIEIHMDLTSPEFHPHARDTKDVSAGGVLIAVIITLVVFALIFTPKILCLVGL